MKKRIFVFCGVMILVFVLTGNVTKAEGNVYTLDVTEYSSSNQYDSDLDVYFGWLWKDSKWYYYEEADLEHPGEMVKDCIMTIKGEKYLFDANGCMLTGWQKRLEGWYYADTNGRIQTGWQYIKGYWYFLQSDGVMAEEWLQLDNKWYYLGSNGAMKTGWQYIKGYWYFLQPNGAMACDWLK